MRIALVMAAALVIVGCGGDEPGDASARLACTHFRDVARDYTDGVLTIDELRSKMGDVYDDAELSDVPGLAPSARTMVAELTAGRMGDDFNTAVRSFGDACRSIDL